MAITIQRVAGSQPAQGSPVDVPADAHNH